MSEVHDDSVTYRWLSMKAMGIVVVVLLSVVALWIGLGALTFQVSTKSWFDGEGFTERAAQIGDTFGATNALFSALAIALVAVSTILQTQELRAQRITVNASQEQLKAQLAELALAREEARLTREEHAKSAESLKDQAEMTATSACIQALSTLAQMETNGIGDLAFGPRYKARLIKLIERLEVKYDLRPEPVIVKTNRGPFHNADNTDDSDVEG